MTLTRITSDGITDAAIVNADINASAAIAGTKISPDFGSQNIATTGTLGSGDMTITGSVPALAFTESDGNPDFTLRSDGGIFRIRDVTNTSDRIQIQADGTVDITGNLDAQSGIDVTGAIVGTGDLTIDTNTLHVDSSNNRVGIGTTGPGKPLDVVGEMRANAFIGRTNISAPSEDTSIYRAADNTLAFGTAQTERMRINQSGNVGIGTTSPVQQSGIGLHINNGSGQSRIKLTNNNTGSTANDGFDIIQETEGNGNIHFLNHENSIIKFGTNDTERMRIDSSGKVGIGTTSPSGTLDVVGSSPVTAEFKSTNASGGYLAFQMGGSGANIGYLGDSQQLVSTGGNAENLAIRADHGLELVVSTTRKVRIDSDGLKFGTDTAAANALDDYEETSWTPTVASGIDGGASYSIQRGYAVKIGCFVHFSFFIRFGGTGNGNQLLIGGLPYLSASNPYGSSYNSSGSIGYENANFNNTNTQQLFIGNNSQNIYFYNQGHQSSTISGSNSSQDIYASGSYRTAT